jgi:hypothetical protein
MKKLFTSLLTLSLLTATYPAHAFDIKWEKKHTYIIAAAVALIGLGMGLYATIKGRQQTAHVPELISQDRDRDSDSPSDQILTKINIINTCDQRIDFNFEIERHPA